MRKQGGRAQKKQENVRELLKEDYNGIKTGEPVLPLHYNDKLDRLLPYTAKVFQSAMTPIALEFIIKREPISFEYTSRRASFLRTRSNWTGNTSDTADTGDSTSTVRGAERICCTCPKSFGDCECKKCFCNASFGHSNLSRHHCRRCCRPICSACSEGSNDNRHCIDKDICDRFAYGVLRVMVKNGDDVRQDQMVIQIIRLMDKLLSDVSLNLCLSPYDVVAMK